LQNPRIKIWTILGSHICNNYNLYENLIIFLVFLLKGQVFL
jgi:hypothetical protein